RQQQRLVQIAQPEALAHVSSLTEKGHSAKHFLPEMVYSPQAIFSLRQTPSNRSGPNPARGVFGSQSRRRGAPPLRARGRPIASRLPRPYRDPRRRAIPAGAIAPGSVVPERGL